MPATQTGQEAEEYPESLTVPVLGDARLPSVLAAAFLVLAKRANWLRKRVRSLAKGKCSVTFNASTDTFTATAGAEASTAGHELTNGDQVQILGTPPTGFSTSTTYYVVSSDRAAGTFQLSTTNGGSPVNGTSAGASLFVVRDSASELGSFLYGLMPAGTVSSQLRYLYDAFAKLAANNVWVGANEFQGDLTVSGNAIIDGTMAVAGSVVFDTFGKLVQRYNALSDADATIEDSVFYDAHKLPATLTGTRNITLDDQTAARVVWIFRPSYTAGSAAIKDSGGSTIYTFSGAAKWAAFLWDGVSGWVVMAQGTY